MKKKIGIITSTQSFCDNYGAILQAFALSYKLKKLDLEPLIIRYKIDGEYLKGTAPLSRRFKATLLNRNLSFHAKKVLLKNRILNKSTASVFSEFSKRYLQFYNEKYVDFDTLNISPPNCDAFITGSDQVWNPVIHNNTNDPGYFLDFVPPDKRRIAYAPSIGVSRIPDNCRTNLKDYLKKFYVLSIREQSGADIIKDVCNIDVPIVLDPTLLLSDIEWDEVCLTPDFLPEKYILCYKFGKSKIMDKTIQRISSYYNFPIVAVPASPETKYKMDYRIGPSEFLGAIKNAQIICNDSFHASVFSIIYNKPFLTFPRHEQQVLFSMNSRMTGLLKMLSLENRYITSENQINVDEIFDISFDHVNAVLKEKRANSMVYLEKSLQGI